MYISKFQIRNYKSFLESDEIELKPSFNVIVGKNNSGKTALVETLTLRYTSKPHRSTKTLPSPESHWNQASSTDITFELTAEEIRDAWFKQNPKRFNVPKLTSLSPHDSGKRFLDTIKGNNSLECTYSPENFSAAHLKGEDYGPNEKIARLEADAIERTIAPTGVSATGTPNYGVLAARSLKERIFFFDAQRLDVGVSAHGKNTELASDASNLAEVLNVLQGSNPYRFDRFNDCVRAVFPHIKRITVRSIGKDRVEILVWNVDPSTERADLAIPLSESGTGIGQVLAMLYVVLTADYPRVIIIDEPQSFLHPGAVRRLVGIMKQHPQHQYIMTTHSPAVITASEPSTLTLARLEESETQLKSLDVSENEDLRISLAEVGARLSDVFGADDILWVEGRTEEICFPKILEEIAEQPLLGTEILGVEHTGDFEGRHAKTIFDIYDKLSTGRGLLPPAVGFIFDREGRSKQDRDDLTRKSKGSVQFTARRMYENYLLNRDAIVTLINRDDELRDEPVTADEVKDWIEQHGSEFTNQNFEFSSDEWIREVHAANLLDELFIDLTETRVQFDKVHHSTALTKWLIEHSAEDLQEIADMLVEAIRHEDLSQTVDAAPAPSNH